MKIKRNGPPSQPWDVTFRSGSASVTYRVDTPLGKEHYDLAVKHASVKMKADPVWTADDNTEVETCKYAKPRKRTQTWVGGSIKEGGHWKHG